MCRLINCNKCTTLKEGVDNGVSYRHVELIKCVKYHCSFPLFFYEPKSALKIFYFLNKCADHNYIAWWIFINKTHFYNQHSSQEIEIPETSHVTFYTLSTCHKQPLPCLLKPSCLLKLFHCVTIL